jgi:membrane associated rhomboid family serine protease
MAWQDRHYNQDGYHGGGGRLVGGRSGMRGWSMTKWLIVITVAVFFIDGFSARIMGRPAFSAHGGLMTDWGHFSVATALHKFQIWRFISFQFLHAGLFHILFNMMILFYLGARIEAYLGSRRYLAFYLISGIGGAVLYVILWGLWMLTGKPNVPFLLPGDVSTSLVGASAGIFGVLIACAIIAPHDRIHLLFPPISLTLRALATVLILIAVFMVMVNGDNAGGEAAHLGGALMGYLLIKNVARLNWVERFPARGINLDGLRQTHTRRKKKRMHKREAQLDAQVDRILKKVHEQGMHCLTDGEKRTLQQDTKRRKDAV